jgi:hypothetical protein
MKYRKRVRTPGYLANPTWPPPPPGRRGRNKIDENVAACAHLVPRQLFERAERVLEEALITA